jgi:16S rRNA pseudouridine516 synthase
VKAPQKAPMARLDRLLANLGYGSRREVTALVARGQVELDGATLKDAGARIAAAHPVDPPAPLTILMHKPLGVVCSHREPGRSVYELLPPRWQGRLPALSSIGRLDKETSGLLLITDDGPFLHRVISPKSQVAKRYVAALDRPLAGNEAEAFAAGTMMLESETEPLAPAVLESLSGTQARLTITEGRYHQVRRMFAAVGNHVTALHRDRIGGLDLPEDLAPGAWRILSPAQQASIFT